MMQHCSHGVRHNHNCRDFLRCTCVHVCACARAYVYIYTCVQGGVCVTFASSMSFAPELRWMPSGGVWGSHCSTASHHNRRSDAGTTIKSGKAWCQRSH